MRSATATAHISKNNVPSPRGTGTSGNSGGPETPGGAFLLPDGVDELPYGLVLPISMFSAANGTV